MTETFRCDDKDRLVAYLYDELDAASRTGVDAHLRQCEACAAELAGLGGVRRELVGWQPPDVALGFTIVPVGIAPAAAAPPRSLWQEVPAWARLAAAVLVMAIGLSVANVQVRYDAEGMVVTTGWMTPAAPQVAREAVPVAAVPAAAAASDEAWRTELTALEQRLRADLAAPAPLAVAGTRPASPAFDADDLLARVTALVEESELRQRQELAYRLTQFNRDMEMQRRADLVRIERGVGQMEGRTGAEVARQREMLNYLVRASQQRPQ
ncbi:MAG: zf-HC2 domain-containing protein [Vicinamibacterales bacterium]|nr:zf-HC2 domain-containing protein [Vicinamibacterales bacterium]